MQENTSNQEDEVYNVQVQVEGSKTREVQNDVYYTHGTESQVDDRKIFQLLCGRHSCNLFLCQLRSFFFSQQGRIDANNILFVLGVHHGCNDRQHNQCSQNDEQVGRREQGLCNGSSLCHCSTSVSNSSTSSRLCRDRQRNRARESSVPPYESSISRSNQQAVVNTTELLGNFLSIDSTNNQTESPVQDTGYEGYDGYKGDSLEGSLRNTSKLYQQLLKGGSKSKHVTSYQNQYHLHTECQQSPNTLSPVVQHSEGSLSSSNHTEHENNYCQNNSKQECVRQEFLHECGCTTRNPFQHTFF